LDLCPGELGSATFVAIGGEVLCRATEEEVGWIPAGWSVASVKDVEALGDGTFDECPGEAMSGPEFLVVVDRSVAFGGGSSVEPAIGLWVNVCSG
jgi:hypothetical protein